MGSTFYRARIAGTGSYLPEKKLTNHDIEKMVETSDEWIRERTGIASRSIAADDQVTSDLALIASERALEAANLKATDIDAIFVATVSGDHIMPATSCVLQRKLGCNHVMSVDLSAACSGFLYGMGIATDMIMTGRFKNILVVGAEILHNFVDYTDRDTCILFGDGAGAFIMSRAEEDQDSDVFSHHMQADGYISHLLELPLGSAHPINKENLDAGWHLMRMKGREVFKNAVRTMSSACKASLEENKMQGSDIDWVVPHQANVRILEAVAKMFGIPMEKVIVEIENMGNTSSATIPVAFDKAVRDGRIKRGQNLLFTAFGAGMTSGSLLMRY